MTTSRGGRKYKDAKITENFNQSKAGITKKDITRAKRIAAAEKRLGAKAKQVVPVKPKSSTPNFAPQPDNAPVPVIIGFDDDGWPVFEPIPSIVPWPGDASEPLPSPGSDDEDDEVSAHQMLADMRWVYKKVQGRTKLKDLMAGDKEFMGMVKELMKAEVSILTNKAKGGGNNRQGFFVILKGLEEEKPILKAIQENRLIDIKQIERAINPADYVKDEEESAQDTSAGPAQIIKKAENVESPENW